MEVRCVLEHNGLDSLLYCADFPGAYSRGSSPEEAVSKMEAEVSAYLRWIGREIPDTVDVVIIQKKESALLIRDADSDVLFDEEQKVLTREAYETLKALALRSAADFQRLYDAVPDPDKTVLTARRTFYGAVPGTAREMYEHTKNVNEYYFWEVGVYADNEGGIEDCRRRGFGELEQSADFLTRLPRVGSYGEEWSLRKLLRRFIWHDRIHAKAMYRMAVRTFGRENIADIFRFEG